MGQCRSCYARVEWVRTESGRRMPVEETEGGNIRLDKDLLGERVAVMVPEGEGTHVSHFARCPQSKEWRR